MLLYSLLGSTLKSLQQVINYDARKVTRLGRSEYLKPLLHDLHWLLVDMQIV